MTLASDAAQVIAYKNQVKSSLTASQAILDDPASATETQLVALATQVKDALTPLVQDLEVLAQGLTDESVRNPSA